MKVHLLLVACLISGCSTAPKSKLPPELVYLPPTEPAESLAYVKGQIVKSKMPLFDNFNTYVYAIDGKHVRADRKSWASPVALLAGKRIITAAFERGVYMAFAKVEVSIVPGSAYEVRSDCPSSPIGKPYKFCDFWVVDLSSEKPVSEVMRARVGGEVPTVIIL